MERTARSKLFTLLEILKQATSTGAELVSLSGPRNRYKEGKLGVVEAVAYADLVIANKNPLENITVLSDPENVLTLIVKDGNVYKNTLN